MSAFEWSTMEAKGFPKPTRDLSQDFSGSTARTTMDSGRNRQRPRFTSGFRSIPVSWEVTDALFGLFQGVVKYKLHSGADFFNVSLPLGDGFETVSARFVANSNGSVFKSAYQDTMNWKISAVLEVENDSALSEAEVDAALA